MTDTAKKDGGEIIEAMAREICNALFGPYENPSNQSETSTEWQSKNAAQAALSVAKPMIERRMLRELIAYAERHSTGIDYVEDTVWPFAKERGIDLEPKP